MGYTTDFTGSFTLDRPLTIAHAAYLNKFSETRRMKRDSAKTALRCDPLREAVGLPVGLEGGYFVGSDEAFGQEHTTDILDWNSEPSGQPGLWCLWAPTEDGQAIEWNGGEKFYCYAEWLTYLIDHFLKPWGYVLNGEVEWSGEDRGDIGKLVVSDNAVTAKAGKISYE